MATAITMVPVSLSGKSKPALLLALLICAPLAAEVRVEPEIESKTVAYWIRNEQTGGGLDKGLAQMLAPAISLTQTAKQMSNSLYLKNEAIWYDDSQRDAKNLSSFIWNSRLNGFEERLTLALNAQTAHRVRSSGNNIFSDVITGSENLSRTSSHGATLGFQNHRASDIQTRLSLTYRRADSERPDNDDGITDFTNKSYLGSVEIGRARRHSAFFWQLNANYNKTEREFERDFLIKSYSADFGMPLFGGLAAVVRGSYEENDNITGYYDNFRSYGYGLEYQFGKVSRINVTRNHSVQSGALAELEEEKDTYYAVDAFIAPSRRTSLSYRLDRRYFGRSVAISGQYNLRTVTARLSVTDSVQTLSNLELALEDLGIFVCPDGVVQISECIRPPSNNYQPQPGESFQQFFQQNLELNEQLVQRRAAVFNLGYSHSRIKLNLTLSRSDDNYIDTPQFNETRSIGVSSSWQFARNMQYELTARFYDIDYQENDRSDSNALVETGVVYDLNDDASVKAMFRRTDRNSSQSFYDFSENRVWLSYRHRL